MCKKLAKNLIKNDWVVSVAESCTGGLISSILTDISGSSAFIKQNFVTYSNNAKEKYLSVNSETLSKKGAVSSEVARQMALGLIKNTNSDFALATTGVAGPTGGTPEKPVGLVYIGIADKTSVKTIKYNVFRFLPRKIIKYLFAKKALKELEKFVEKRNKTYDT